MLPINSASLNQAPNNIPPEIFNKYKEISQNMELQFVKLLLNQMRKTIVKNSPDGTASTYYKSLLYNEYAKKLVQQDSNGMGLQKVILDNILPKKNQNINNNFINNKIKIYRKSKESN